MLWLRLIAFFAALLVLATLVEIALPAAPHGLAWLGWWLGLALPALLACVGLAGWLILPRR